MGKLLTTALLLLGVAAIVAGLLPLLGLSGRGRIMSAMVLLSLGGGLIGLGLRSLRRARAESPAFLEAELLRVAAMHGGALEPGDLVPALGSRAERALARLHIMASDGRCERRGRGKQERWVFSEELDKSATARSGDSIQ